jgi:lipopolysaccharide export system permease protein
MRILRRYIGSTMIKLTLMVLVIVLGMEFFIVFVGELGDIGTGNYGLLQALRYVVLTLPMNLYQLFPMVGLLGSLIGLGALGSNSELIVMRTSGVSVYQIIQAVVLAAIILIAGVTFIGECVAPEAQHIADTGKIISESGGQALNTTKGLWVRHGNDFVHIQTISPGLILHNIVEYHYDDQGDLMMALQAKSAERIKGVWQLRHVKASYIGKNKITTKASDRAPWPVPVDAKLLGVTKNNAQELSIVGLYHYIKYEQRNGLNVSSYALTFWQRVFQPLATLIMILLAVPFVFGPLRQVSMGVRIVTGAVLGFAFYLLNQFFGPFSLVYQVSPIVGASLPIILFACLAIWLMTRVR